MAINFKLEPVKEISPELDDMSRSWVGWSPTHTSQTTYEQNRGIWALGPRADLEGYATFSADGVIRVVVEIDRIELIPSKDSGRRSKRAIVGRVLDAADPVFSALVGQPADAYRNPVTYIEDPLTGPRRCACGCGEPVTGSRAFLVGHDQRALRDRITRRWGNTLRFIEWFDANDPDAAS